MKSVEQRLRVGIVLTGLLTLLFTLVFSLDSASAWWSGSSTVLVRFDCVQGLRPSDPVHFHGVPSGRVARIEFVGEEGADGIAFATGATPERGEEVDVLLHLEIPTEIAGYLRSGTVAKIEKTLTGVTIVNLTQGSGFPLRDDAVLEGENNATIDDITNEMEETVVELRSLLASIKGTADSIREQDLIPSALRSIRTTGDEATLLAQELRGVVEETRENFVTLSREGALVAEDLRGTAGRVDALAGRLSDWFIENRPALSATVEDIARSAENAETFSSEIRRRPWRLLHSPTKKEAIRLELYESVDLYARGALELRRCLERVQSIMEADASPEIESVLKKALEELEGRVSQQAELESSFWRRLESIED